MTSIIVEGTVIKEPAYSHETYGIRYYETYVASTRKSEVVDCFILLSTLPDGKTHFRAPGSVRTGGPSG